MSSNEQAKMLAKCEHTKIIPKVSSFYTLDNNFPQSMHPLRSLLRYDVIVIYDIIEMIEL